MDIHKVIGKLPRPKREFVLLYHKYTALHNPLQLDEYGKPVPRQEPYNAGMIYLCVMIPRQQYQKWKT